MLSSVDTSLVVLCGLFAPPFALSLLVVLHALHKCNFHLWQAKVHCYQSADRLHIAPHTRMTPITAIAAPAPEESRPRQPSLLRQQPNTDGRTGAVELQQSANDAPPTVKEAIALLPPHRQEEARRALISQHNTSEAGSGGGGPRTVWTVESAEAVAERSDFASLHTAGARWRVSRWLSASLLLAVCLPALQISAWAASLVLSGYGQCAAALVLLTACIGAVVVAFGRWQGGGWYWSAHVAQLLTLALTSFIALSLVLSFLSADSSSSSLSFFSRSIHFVCLHLVLSVECRAVSEHEAAASLQPYIRAHDRDSEHERSKRRAEKRRKLAQRLSAVGRMLGCDVHQQQQQQQNDSDDEDEQQRQQKVRDESDDDNAADAASDGGSGGPGSRLSDLPSETHSFASHIQAKAAKARLKQRTTSQRRLLMLHVAGVLTLVAYSAVIGAQVDAPNTDSEGSFDGRFLGLLVSLSILLFDMFVSLLADRLSTAAQLSLALLTRLVLVSFDDRWWFVGFCFLFILFGCVLTYLWADSFLPSHRLSSRRVTRTLSTRPVRMTLTSFLTDPAAANSHSGVGQPLFAALQSADSLLSIPAFLCVVLLTLFLMALCVAYTTHPPLVSLGGVSSVEFDQWMAGVLAILLWLVASAAVFLVKSLLFYSFRLNALTCCACVCVQLVFVCCGFYLWRESDSVLFLLLFCLLPPFCVSLLATYSLSVANLPSQRSVRSLVACALCVVLLAALGASLSVLFSPSHVGWSAVFCVLILLSSGLPVVKYRTTLTLDAVDEWSVLLCLLLLSGFLSLLAWRLSLSSFGYYCLALCGSGYVIFVLAAAAWSDWRLQSRLTPFSFFVLSAHYVWLLTLSAVLCVPYSASTAVSAVVGAVLYMCLSLCFLYWLWNGCRLPRSLQWVLAGVVCLFLLSGAGAAVYYSVSSESDPSVSFFAFSAVYLFLVLSVALCAAFHYFGSQYRAPCLINFSSSVFPVFLFNKRTSGVSHLNLPLCLLLSSGALFVLWCLVCIVCGYRDVGLSSSALCVVVLWLVLRELSFSSHRSLLPLRTHLDECSVLRVRSSAWRLVCGGYEGDEEMMAAVRSLEAGHDVRRGLRDKQRLLRQRMSVQSSSNPLTALWRLVLARPSVGCFDVDWLLSELSGSESAIRQVSCLNNTLDAQCAFMLRMEGETRRREDESLFALFCVWARKHKPHIDTLHPDMQPSDTLSWTPAERRNVRLAVDEWNRHRASRREECERDRLIEQHATKRREQLSLAADALGDTEAGDDSDDAKGDDGSDPYAAMHTTGQARGSSAPAFTANSRDKAATQRNRLRATRQRQQQQPCAQQSKKQQRQPHIAPAAKGSAGGKKTSQVNMGHSAAPTQPARGSTSEKVDSAQAAGDDTQVKPEDSEQTQESEREETQRQDEEKAASGSVSSDESAVSVSVPAVVYSHEEAHALFSRIAAQFDSSGVRWVDDSFPASDASIYLGGRRDATRPSAVHQAPVSGWQRPDAILRAVKENGAVDGGGEVCDGVVRVVADGYSCNDVVQGNIGTCYFLSALGVMALHKQTEGRPPLLSSTLPSMYNNSPSHPCGCYLVCLYRRHTPMYLFVDDQLPVQANGLPAFSHCRHAGELWVALLEKAYAKLFGCYEAIEAGYVHQALMDCTSGQGEEIRLKEEDGRLRQAEEVLWVKLFDAFNGGCMLGAGSNTGTNDHQVDGIVQGHAYGIIGLYEGSANEEADSGGRLRLIQLNNPWGRGEWTGDWSDESDKWTRYYINRLKPTTQDDGRFWMEFGDFVQHFENVYICRIVPHATTLDAKWDRADGSACGPRQPRNNPHFTLRSDRNTTVHIELEQDAVAAAAAVASASSQSSDMPAGIGSNGYAYIQFYLLDNGGQRVEKITRSAVRGWANDGRLVNARSISAQAELEAGKEYALLCCTNIPDVERAFSVSVFSCDPVTLTAMI